MLKKITYILSAVMLCSCVMLVSSFESKAANYTISMSRPEATTNSGYVELLVRDRNSGVIFVSVYFWNCWGVDGNKTVDVHVSANECSLVTYSGYLTVFNISSDGRDNPAVVSSGTNSSYTFNSLGFNQEIFGYRVYGNVGVCDSSIGGYIADWTVLYSDEATEVYELTQIYSQLVQSNANDSTMINKINQIYNSVDTVESKLQQLIELQNTTNTWLEKIFDWLNESKEQEKQEVQTQGSNSVSQGSDSIENSGQGFGDSMGGLVSSMSYTGTDCSWTFPEVKIPAIKGVIDETVLIEQQPINFGVWIDSIPSNIMLLIRSVLTGALIIYCFKELYGTISYVLTLKRSGVNE